MSMDRADLDYLINGIVSGLGGGVPTGRNSTLGTSRMNFDSFAEFEDAMNKYRERLVNDNLERISEFNFQLREIRKEQLEELNREKEQLEQEMQDVFSQLESFTGTADEKLELENKKFEIASRYRDVIRDIVDKEEKLSNSKGLISHIKDGKTIISTLKNMYGEIRGLVDPWAKADAAVSKYAKSVGMAAKGMNTLRNDTLKNVTNNRLSTKYNVSTEELLEAQSNYLKASGRNIRVSNIDQESIAAMRAIGGNGNDLAAMYDNFGVSVEKTADHVGKMFADASKEGISFEKYSDNVAKNIKIAQNYTFKNGLKGLESMAKKATAMKLDMQQVAQLADKVSTVEGAIDVSAQLQVLGGPFAKLADPMGMLNEGLNDMEALQDRLIKMIGGLGSFDKETGEVRVSAFNKQRIKAAASAMGTSYDALMESVNAQARRGEIEKQISASVTASKFDDEMKELIKNSGVIKDGKAGVSIRGQFKSLDELSGNDYEALKTESRTESEDIKDIAINLRSIVDVEEGRKKQTDAWQARMFGFLGVTLKGITKAISWLRFIHVAIVSIKTMLAGYNMFTQGQGMWRGIRGAVRGNVGGSANVIGGNGGTRRTVVGSGSSWARILGQTLTDPKRGLANLGTKLTGGIVKDSIGRTAKRASIKLFGRQATSIMATKGATAIQATNNVVRNGITNAFRTAGVNTGGNLLKGLAKGGALSIVGTIGNIATDTMVSKGKMKRGGVGHHTAKGLSGAASGAGLGAMIGSIFPVIGTAIGTAIGGAIGGFNGLRNANLNKQITKKLEKSGTEIVGSYGNRKLKYINKSLEDGHISKRMRTKLEKSGDHALVEQIDKVASQTGGKRKFKDKEIAKYVPIYGAYVRANNVMKKMSETKIGKALGMSSSSVSMFSKNRKKAKESASSILNRYNTTVKPILEKGISTKYGEVNKSNNNNNIHIKTDPHDIRLNGTLKIQGQDGKTYDIVNELRNNPQMLRSVTNMIANQMDVIEKGANVTQRL